MEILTLQAQGANVTRSASLTDLRAKLFAEELQLDRGPKINEDKYNTKVLIGNWFEQRQSQAEVPNDWKTIYQNDFKMHNSNEKRENENTRWDNQLNIEGLPREQLFENSGEEYFGNLSTCYDLKYNILQKRWKKEQLRIYNARKLGWIPEEDLTISYGNVTEFGLRDMLKTKWEEESEERAHICRWQTTYKMNISTLSDSTSPVCGKFKRQKVDFNVPNLEHFKDHKPDIRPCYFPFVAPTSIVN